MLCYALRLRMLEHIATALGSSFKQLLQTVDTRTTAAAPATPTDTPTDTISY